MLNRYLLAPLAVLLLAIPRFAHAQTGGVRIGTAGTPDASAALDIVSTSKGLLPPRLSKSQRDAIASPAAGLTIYNTTNNKLNTWNGIAWAEGISAVEQTVTATTTTFGYTGAVQTYTVPTNVSTLRLDVRGAQGGSESNGNAGGLGAQVQTTLAVTAGQVLYLYVGGTGTLTSTSTNSGGFNGGGNNGAARFGRGGGGGGATDVRTSASGTTFADRLVVAGGGGGGGGNGTGGSGGAPNGANGNGGSGGTGATQTSGNALGQGGNNFPNEFSGGGGGGYWGGGFGGNGGSGGGGSSWATPTGSSSTTMAAGVQAGNGSITLTTAGSFVSPALDGSNITNVPGTWQDNGTDVYRPTGSVGVGTGRSIVASAQLEVASTSKGFLPPRLTLAQRDAMAAPATGLIIYNTTTNKLNTWNGTSWDAALSNAEQPYQNPTATFTYTGQPQTYTVPAGVTSLSIDASGGQGGAYRTDNGQLSPLGGGGARVQATLAVTPGEMLTIYVGGMGATPFGSTGAGGYNGGGNGYYYGNVGGGGGGGASDVRRSAPAPSTALGERVLVAAGGGGRGYSGASGGFGGGGGDPNGSDGGGAIAGYIAGTGATQSTGGIGGGGLGDGSLGQGGNAGVNTANNPGSGGGGGGGYYGGGGGSYNGGGGGGSSWVTPTGSSGVAMTNGSRTGAGVVVISSTPVYAAPALDGSNFVNVPGAWTVSGADVYRAAGNVGVGTATPGQKLDVNGSAAIRGSAGIGTGSPVASAQLEVASTSKGFLPPRLTQDQADAIASPAPGLVIYNTTTNKLNVWNGTSWTEAINTTETTPVLAARTFTHTGAVQTYIVPPGVTTLRADALGGKGGPGYGGRDGGAGARVQATLSVTPGEVLTVYVGGGGGLADYAQHNGNGFNGGGAGYSNNGGGGGGTDIRRGAATLTNRLLVAGGGGGATSSHGAGSAGYTGTAGSGTYAGGGGSQTAGGGALNSGAAGSLGQGGSADAGGGGGYYGGGGGYDGASGGGGSSYVTPVGSTAITYTDAANSAGNGQLTLTPIRAVPAPVLDATNFINLPTSGDNLGNHTATQNLNLGTNQLVGNGGSTGVAISSAGNVGIGTTAPYTQLANTATNVIATDGNGTSSQALNWVSTTTGYAGAFANSNAAASGHGLAVKVASASASALDISQASAVGTAGTSLLRVNGNGNVGIGTTAAQPATQRLDVRGNVRLGTDGGNAGTGQAIEWVGPGVSSDPVGIYRVNPATDQSELRVVVGDTPDANDKFVVGRSSASVEGGIPSGTFTANFTVNAAGNVGIGVADPQAGLHIDRPESANAGPGVSIGGGSSGNPSIELRGTSNKTPYIDFAESNGLDYSVRLISSGGALNLNYGGAAASKPGNILVVGGNVQAGAFNVSSDQRFKTNVRPIGSALSSVLALRGVRYEWNALGVKHGGTAGAPQVGLLAQEVEKIYPELVSTGPDGYKAVNYAQLAPVLIEALKEQQQQIEALKARAATAEAKAATAETQAAQATADHASLLTLQAQMARLLGEGAQARQ